MIGSCLRPRDVFACGLLLGMASLVLAWATHGLSASFIDPDESSHYVDTLFIADWLRAGLPAPMTFARDYYAHFPKLAIGHWPPGWYALMAPLYAILRPSPLVASVLSAFVAGLPAVLVVWGVARAGIPRFVGVAAAIAMLLLPIVTYNARYVLLDQPTALIVGAAAVAWLRAVERPTLWRYGLFAALGAFATLVKGNGALIALVPALDILFARRWRQLGDPRMWIAAVGAAMVVLPWYYVSYKIAAGGFNYAAGLPYASLSLQADAGAIIANFGWLGVALALFGVVTGWRGAESAPIARLAVAIILATLVFQAAVPVALEERYVLPALPWLIVLVALGLCAIARRGRTEQVVAGLCAAALIVPAAWSATHQAPKIDIGAPALARQIVSQPGIWLIDGRAGGEGAVIAAAAYADEGRRAVWTARASQWLSTSDFMGTTYRLRVADAQGARAVLDRLGVNGIVSLAPGQRLAYPHSALLRGAVALHGFYSTLGQGDGSVEIAIRRMPLAARSDLLAEPSGNVAAMGRLGL